MKFIYYGTDFRVKEKFEADDLRHQGSCVALLRDPVPGSVVSGSGSTFSYTTPRAGYTLGVVNLQPGERIIAEEARITKE
jgi:hypothetical protein